ncbi:MAG: hypothetical protein PGMFKBFP_02859 [Anaerolineales bacterium]|nr:hypothetical protein [Anaerolineales bacterium]
MFFRDNPRPNPRTQGECSMEGAEKARGLERYIGLDIHKEYALVVGHGRKRAPGIDLQTVRQICLVEVGRRDRHHALCAEGRAASGGLQRRDAGALFSAQFSFSFTGGLPKSDIEQKRIFPDSERCVRGRRSVP